MLKSPGKSGNAKRGPVVAGRIAIATLWTTICIAVPAFSDTMTAKPASLTCNIGPLTKTYGKTQWLVYSCDDGRTLVVVSAPGNPATPFVFALVPNKNGYRVVGEGTGRKKATAAALEDLKKLSAREIKLLIEQTKQR